ncbi:MAG: hypothetical protein LBC17_02195 [Lactobacillaceae bacterium]|jgi:uncharacterized ubiquitin-like protein YukD|nr:hypothetical protein [Lactobacillaceae bacterium]
MELKDFIKTKIKYNEIVLDFNLPIYTNINKLLPWIVDQFNINSANSNIGIYNHNWFSFLNMSSNLSDQKIFNNSFLEIFEIDN